MIAYFFFFGKKIYIQTNIIKMQEIFHFLESLQRISYFYFIKLDIVVEETTRTIYSLDENDR